MPQQGPAATLTDVAAHAGVSLATASRVLNGSTRVVGQALQEKVLASARALGYVVDAQAQAVARGTSSTIALVVGDIADPYFSSVAAGAIAAARRRSMTVTISTVTADPEDELQAVDALRAQRPRAIVLARSRHVDSAVEAPLRHSLDAYRARGGAVAAIGGTDPSTVGERVVPVANREGAADLARALVDLGYRRFALLGGDGRLVTPRDRVEGFVEGARSRGLDVDPSHIVWSAFSRAGGREAALDLLDAGAQIDCMVAATDVMAVGAMAALRERGIAPGAGVGVSGFDDIAMLADVRPALTTVALPLDRIGERAVELALSEDGDVDEEPVVLRGEVRIRESTPRRG